MDVSHHMEILESIRTHGGRGTPIGYSDYVVMDSPASGKLLPQVQQLGIRGVKPSWIQACIEGNELLPSEDWEINEEADLLPETPQAQSERASTGNDTTDQKAQKEKRRSNTPVRLRNLESFSNLSPEEKAALPAAPAVLVPHAGGYRFTHEDSQFLIDYANVRFGQNSRLSISSILREVANHTRTSHSYESWRRYYKDQTEVWKIYVRFPSAASASLDAEDDRTNVIESSLVDEDSGQTPVWPTPSLANSKSFRRLVPDADRPLPSERPSTPSTDVDMEAGSGQRYTREEIEYFFDFVAWSYMQDPHIARTTIIRNLAEKMPRHSTGSWSSVWFTQKHALENIVTKAIRHVEQNGRQRETSDNDDLRSPSVGKMDLDLSMRKTPPPEPPSNHKFNSNGFREYPPEDYRYLMDLVSWIARKHAKVTHSQIVRILLQQAPYHTERGWDNYVRKHKAEVLKAIAEASSRANGNYSASIDQNNEPLLPQERSYDSEADFEQGDWRSTHIGERTFEAVLAHLETLEDPWNSSEEAWEGFASVHPDYTAQEWRAFLEESKPVLMSAMSERKALRDAYFIETELNYDTEENDDAEQSD
ncbi:hypothetical protein DACRYDRAFT_96798 [Dacryopinax primogenitus]|uniref:BRCT domain-containing protein n=1 Tax=Dacryopinax primogenitus (strain DJM 731) TaxID=1858805 RepID=M5G3C5_DACPD|nr:uncharacterized protein DACRYDRAFT_96798 [Dacryopinax primogenitus]EJT98262.1 hypothetical protein DACRYDRAFT_96798 [Dacryopinax primogenitus]